MRGLLGWFGVIFGLRQKIMGEQLRQVLAVIVIVFMDIIQEVNKPIAEVYPVRLAATKHGIHDCCIFGCIVVSTEQPVLPA